MNANDFQSGRISPGDDCCALTCTEGVKLIYRLVDNELAKDRILRVQRHLEVCNSCREEYRIDALLKNRIRTSCGEPSMPTDLKDRVRARLVLYRETHITIQRTES